MKNFLLKHWALIGLIAAFLLDNVYDILNGFGFDELTINIIKGLGVIIVGYFWNPAVKKARTATGTATEDTEDTSEGDGAVKPSKGF